MVNKIKVLDRQIVDLSERLDDAVYYVYSDKRASLNLKECKIAAMGFGIDFYEYVARCINHEFLHYVLDMEHSEAACIALDRIAKQYIDFWMW